MIAMHTSTDILTLVDVSSELYRPFWRTGQSPVNRADRYMLGIGAELVSRQLDERMNVRAGARVDSAFENAAGADELVADIARQTALPSTWLALDGALAEGDPLLQHQPQRLLHRLAVQADHGQVDRRRGLQAGVGQ